MTAYMSRSYDPSEKLMSLVGGFPKPANDLMADIYLEQHLTMSRQMLPVGVINMLASTVVAMVMLPHFGVLKVSLWSGSLIIMGCLQVYAWYSKRKSEIPESVTGNTLRQGEWFALVAGVIWGSLPIYFNLSQSDEIFLFEQMIACGMSAGLVSMLAPLPRHASRFMVPCVLPMALMAIIVGDALNIGIAVLSVVLTSLLINSSLDSYRQLKKSVARNLETAKARNNLIDAIESTNDAFALFDGSGDILLMNERHKAWFGEAYDAARQSDPSIGVKTIKHEGRWLLRSSHQTLDGGHVVVHTDVTTLKSRQRELQEARREAEEADLSKTRFLSTMSHELRTPLNLILGFSRLMASDSKVELQWDEVAEYADNIRESGAHLLKLIDDIIDYSKIGLDKMLLSTTDVDLNVLIDRTVSLAASFENWRDLSKIDISVSPDLGQLRIDETICQRILMNLISNAMRFSHANQKLVIRAGFTADGAPFIAIRDFGCGISETDLEHVFDAFYQCGVDENVGHGGTGLGLTLSRQLAHIHDGEVILKSRENVGTTAMFILPAATHLSHLSDSVEPVVLEHVA